MYTVAFVAEGTGKGPHRLYCITYQFDAGCDPLDTAHIVTSVHNKRSCAYALLLHKLSNVFNSVGDCIKVYARRAGVLAMQSAYTEIQPSFTLTALEAEEKYLKNVEICERLLTLAEG